MQLWALQCVYFFELVFLVLFLNIYPGVELLDHEVVLLLGFLRNLHAVLHRGCASLHPHVGVFCFHWVCYGPGLGSIKVGHCGIRRGVLVEMSWAGHSDPQAADHVSCHILASQVAQWWGTYMPMQETRVQSLGREDLLEKEMATHPSILAWRIHGLQSMGLQRVIHDWVTGHAQTPPHLTQHELGDLPYNQMVHIQQTQTHVRISKPGSVINNKIKSLPTRYRCIWELVMYISLQTCSCIFHPHLQWFLSFKPVCDSHLSFGINWGSWHSRESSVAAPETICHEKSRHLLLEFHPISYNYLCGPGHVNSSFRTCVCVWSHTLHLIVVLVGCLSLLTVQKGATSHTFVSWP